MNEVVARVNHGRDARATSPEPATATNLDNITRGVTEDGAMA